MSQASSPVDVWHSTPAAKLLDKWMAGSPVAETVRELVRALETTRASATVRFTPWNQGYKSVRAVQGPRLSCRSVMKAVLRAQGFRRARHAVELTACGQASLCLPQAPQLPPFA